MATILESISALDLGRLTAHIEAANGTVKIEASFPKLDAAELLGPLGELLRSNEIPANPDEILASVSAELAEFGEKLGIGHIASAVDVTKAIERLVAFLERVVKQFNGDASALIDNLMEEGGSLTQILNDVVEQVLSAFPAEIPDLVREPLDGLLALSKQKPSRPEDLAQALLQIFGGMDLAAFNAPLVKLDGFIGQIRAAGGGPVDIAAEISTVTLKVRNASKVMVQPGVDPKIVIEALTAADASLDLLFNNALPGAIARLTTDLGKLDPSQLWTEMDQAIGGLIAKVPRAPFKLDADILNPLEDVLKMIEGIDAAELTRRFLDVEEMIRKGFEESGIANVPGPEGLFDVVIGRMRSVPIRRLRDELIDAIRDVEKEIRTFPGFTAPQLLAKEIEKIDAAIDAIDLSAIQQGVQQFVEQINAAVQQFPIGDIRDEIQNVVGSVAEIVEQVTPALEAVQAQLDEIGKQIESIDISAAGDVSLSLLHEIRTNVEEVVGSADVPEPVKAGIGAAADLLKGINVSVEISEPFNAALDQIDPSILLEPLKPVVDKVREVLEKVTPQALIEQLDKPFQKLLEALDKLRPSVLLAGLSAEFTRLLSVIDAADPRRLIAPLQAEFEKLIDKLRKVLDPGILFTPLRVLYAKLQELLDLIDFRKLMGALAAKLAGLPAGIGDIMKNAVAARGGTATVPGLPSAPAEVKLGDVLRPLILLMAQLRKLVTDLAQDLVREAFQLLATPLRALRQLASPATGLLGSIAREVDEKIRAIDPFAPGGPAADLRLALVELESAYSRAGLTVEAQAQIGPVAASLELNTRISVLEGPAAGLNLQRSRLSGATPPAGLSAAVRRLGTILDDLLPASLESTSTSTELTSLIDSFFGAFDLASMADRLDELGARAIAKLESLAKEIFQGIMHIVHLLLTLISPFTPAGMLERLNSNLERVKAEFQVLDPAPIEAQARRLVDAVLSGLNAYSPAAMAAQLGVLFDSVKAKLAALNPATLLGDLTSIDAVIDQFGQLKPSIVLAPLLESTSGIQEALERILSLELGEALIDAVLKLRGELEDIVAGVEAELNGLLDFLQGLSGGGGVSGSVSVSAAAG